MTSGFALGFKMDYILFEIAAFTVFQDLFRKICQTHSYAMNIHEFQRYSMDKKHFTMPNSAVFHSNSCYFQNKSPFSLELSLAEAIMKLLCLPTNTIPVCKASFFLPLF